MRVAFLKNVLLREPSYRAALAEVSTPREEVGQPLMRFLRLKNPDPQPAPADETLTFTVETIPDRQPGFSWVSAISLTGDGNPVVVSAGALGIHLPGAPGDVGCRGPNRAVDNDLPTPDAVAAADLNYDFRMDLARRRGRPVSAAPGDARPFRRRDSPGEAAPGASSRSPPLCACRHRHRRRPRSRARAARRPSHCPAQQRRRHVHSARSLRRRHARAWLRMGRPGRRRRTRRGIPGRRRGHPSICEPSRRELPRRDAPRHIRARRGDWCGGADTATRCSICSRSHAREPSQRLSRKPSDGPWAGTALSRVDPPKGPPSGMVRAWPASSPPISTTPALAI